MIPYVIADSPGERKKFTFVNDSLPMLSISYVKCDKYVTHFIRRGVIRYSYGGYVNIYFSMGPYTLWWKFIMEGVIHPYL